MDAKASKQCEGCVELAAKVAELEKQLVAIQDQLAKANKNSATSSKPPSSDITNPPPKRGKPGRPRKPKIGGQPGQKRHERKSFVDEQVDFILEYRYDSCPCCGGTLADAGTEPKKHQSVELIDNPIEITEHHRVEQACVDCGKAHHCPLPDDIRRAGLVEPKMTALIGWLKGVCHMSIGKIKKYSHDVIGVELSRGLIQKLVGKVSQSLADPYQQLLDAISTQSHLNVDETGHKDNEFCIAHLIRDLKFLCVHRDPANQIYGERLREQFRKLFKTIARRKEFVSEATFRRSLERIRNEIVWDATGEQPDTQHAANMAKRWK